MEPAAKDHFNMEALWAIFDNINDAIFICNLDGTIIDANQKTLKMFKIKREDLVKYNHIKHFSGRGISRRGLLQFAEKVLNNQNSRMKWKARRPTEGSHFHVEAFFRKLKLKNKDAIMAIIQDRTHYKKAEESIKKSAEMYRTTFENTGTAMVVLEDNMEISLANHQMVLLTGYDRTEMKGMDFKSLIYPQDLAKFQVYHHHRLKGIKEPKQFEMRVIDRWGQQKTVLLSANLLPKTSQTIISNIEITEIKSMENKIRESKIKIQRLHQVAVKMSSTSDQEEICRLVVDAAEEILKMTLCVVDLVEGDMLKVKAASASSPPGSCRNMRINEGVAGRTLLTGKTFLINDLQSVPELANDDGFNFHSLLSIPIEDLGVFQAISRDVSAFSKQDVELAEILIAHAAEALKRIKYENKIKSMSFHDSLTGLYNRAFFEEELKRLDTERQLPLSIILGDVDGLKLLNDAFGHNEGDRMLGKITKIIKNSCRKEDIICRWGGDEFAVLLPKTDEKTCARICQRIEIQCKQEECTKIPLSISLGMATKKESQEKIARISRKAEEHMYKNKLEERINYRQQILEFLQKSLSKKSYETKKHINNLRVICQSLGKALELSPGQLHELEVLAAIHDIGNIAITEKILRKPGQLSPEEMQTIHRHPEIGYRIADSISEMGSIALGILSHHEWWDGTGYPRGISGKEIPLVARVLAVADAFDVMVTGRPYKKPQSITEAYQELRACSGSQFDPLLVNTFLALRQDIISTLYIPRSDNNCIENF